MATKKRMKEYLASQNIHDVESIDFAESFDDLGPTVRAWSVKTKERDLWVLEGDDVPMNVYPQEFVRLSADEAYSFHMGLMMRMGPPEECDCPACKAGEPATSAPPQVQ